MASREIWIWQTILTPHMASLCEELVLLGNRVTYVASQATTPDRKGMGWSLPKLKGVRVFVEPSFPLVRTLIDDAADDSVHLCQGFRGHGDIAKALNLILSRKLDCWILFETIDEIYGTKTLKRLIYRVLIWLLHPKLAGVLGIGWETCDWLVSRGFPAERVLPFAYFLPQREAIQTKSSKDDTEFKVLFVGQLVRLKRVDWLIESVAALKHTNIQLNIVGNGPERENLEALGSRLLNDRIRFRGSIPISEVAEHMVEADCLVLPSRHDGWGAVISEALMVGTPVICSDSCGAAEIVRLSGFGGVFCRDDHRELTAKLSSIYENKPISPVDRARLEAWSNVLSAASGAKYLCEIIGASSRDNSCICPPWKERR